MTGNHNEMRLRAYIHEHGIRAEHLSFATSCHSVSEAAAAVNARTEDFVKNICLIGPDGRLIVAIVKGEDRVSPANVAEALGLEGNPRLATAAEIESLSGYPCGGTPSFGFEALFVMDERVFEREQVYTGGGSDTSLVRANPDELRRANQGIIACVRKQSSPIQGAKS